ncbi:DASH complex subunit ASK1 [Blastomyces parvus]|uniref:DASH complex subunit ASK1 n=1 Tax=Blastomyces parvus TaxID=2060905 RepID=A0A2B7XLK3_9EURO|nr:DASH complex subunit ASK1 [Blastomyces parvus]
MSRPNPAQRNLTLTEELERLEQSITLTLQEIDHNFSRAHRIVTTNILPTVEQYAEQSREVWEGSKFWKQFFESSANVSLSGYEEHPPSDSGQEGTYTEDTTYTTHTSTDEDATASYATPSSESLNLHHRDDAPDLSSLTITPSHSTPRPKSHSKRNDNDDITSSSIDYPISYETLHNEWDDTPSQSRNAGPVTPGRTQRTYGGAQDTPTTPTTSTFAPPTSHRMPSTSKKAGKPTDRVLHRVLDKTYRIQATPLASARQTYGHDTRGISTPKFKPKPGYLDSSPISSPEIEAPKLHSEIFSSPIKDDDDDGDNYRPPRQRRPSKPSGLPQPGISVLTPAKHNAWRPPKKSGGWPSDDDLDDDDEDGPTALFGQSPPKTMQFHIPHSRLLQTPAKEASKRIVSELLYTAGCGDISDEDENSPSVIRRAAGLEDESF